MSALTAERARRQEQWKYKEFTLLTPHKAWKGGRAVLLGGKVLPAGATGAAGGLVIGSFYSTVDAAAADATVTIVFDDEITVERLVNGTSTHAIVAADVGKLCYALDDQTVSIVPTGKAVAGRIWDVSSTKGVAVQRVASDALAGMPVGTLPAQASNDFILPAANVIQNAVYDVGTTAAASTVTLPAGAPDGTKIYFHADGVKNGHTVTYRDATGPANLSTALTASKKHLAVAVKFGGVWAVNAYVNATP